MCASLQNSQRTFFQTYQMSATSLGFRSANLWTIRFGQQRTWPAILQQWVVQKVSGTHLLLQFINSSLFASLSLDIELEDVIFIDLVSLWRRAQRGWKFWSHKVHTSRTLPLISNIRQRGTSFGFKNAAAGENKTWFTSFVPTFYYWLQIDKSIWQLCLSKLVISTENNVWEFLILQRRLSFVGLRFRHDFCYICSRYEGGQFSASLAQEALVRVKNALDASCQICLQCCQKVTHLQWATKLSLG